MPRNRPTRQPRRTWSELNTVSLFPRWVVLGAAVAFSAGAVWGLVRGLSYLPTLPVAVIEGAILIGVPGASVGVLAAGVLTLIARISRSVRR
jgi:hypothetical protein